MSEGLRFVAAFGWFLVLCAMSTLRQEPPHADVDVDVCGRFPKIVDNCFKDLPPLLKEFLQNNRIIITKEDLIGKCDALNRALKCFDVYSKRCLRNQKHELYKKNIYGALQIFKQFCAVEDFQRDYLLHKECLTKIHSDWLSCSSDFQKIIAGDKLKVTEKCLELCCARYNCLKNSAKFARETAKMLSDGKHISNCRQLEEKCAHATYISFIWNTVVFLALVLVLRYVSRHTKQ